MKVKVISLPYIFHVLYVLCFARPIYQVSVCRTIGPLVLRRYDLIVLSESCLTIWFEPRYEKTVFFLHMRKQMTQISFAVTAKLISAFVFATRIVQSLCFLNPEFQASSHLLWLYSPVCVGPGRKPRRPVFSQRGSIYSALDLDRSVARLTMGFTDGNA